MGAMSAPAAFAAHLARCPIVAILRGVQPAAVVAIGEALVAAGITIIEVPLNSPDPFESIQRLAAALGTRAVVGAGTVLDGGSVRALTASGGSLVVAPNCDPAVIAAGVRAGLAVVPGFFTPTEAFAAIAAGAHALKYFPADGGSPAMFKAMMAVLPAHVPVLAVGGVTPANLGDWRAAGAAGFGLGGALYRAGDDADAVSARAAAFVAAL